MMFAKHSKVFKCVVNKAQVLLCITNQNPQKRMQALCGESTEIVNEPSNNIEKACFDIYYDAIDRVTTELTEIFGNKNSNVLLSLAGVVLRDGTTKHSLRLISDFYSVDLDLLESECKLFHKITCNNKIKTAGECTKFLISNGLDKTLPTLPKLQKYLLQFLQRHVLLRGLFLDCGN